MGWEIAVEAAKIVATEIAERNRIAQESARIAGMLRDNNAELARMVNDIVKTGFSEEKLGRVQNELASLNRLYGEHLEHRRHPENFESPDGRAIMLRELSECTDNLQRTLDILDDADIQDAGMIAYMTAASLRVAALVLRAEFVSGDIANAKRAAREQYLPHAEFMRDTIWPNIIRRFSDVRVDYTWTPAHTGRIGESPSQCFYRASYTLDGQSFGRSDNRSDVERDTCSAWRDNARTQVTAEREEKVQSAVRNSPHAAMVKAIELMRQFADS